MQLADDASFLCDADKNDDPNGDYCCGVVFPEHFPIAQTCPAEQFAQYELCPLPPTHSGGGGNDPHFKTWAGQFFDYHGECDLVLLADPQFYNGLGLVIHIRTKARYEYSFIESAVIQIGDDILEVSGFGQYIINGIAQAEDLDGEGYQMADRFSLKHTQKNHKEHSFVISISKFSGEQIVVSTFKDWVSVKISEGTAANFGNSTGLMGRFNDGATVGRDGTTLRDILLDDNSRNAYGQEWQVLDNDAQLFQTLRAPQFPQKCILPDMKAQARRRRLGERISQSAAEAACAHWKNDMQRLKMCVYDVVASGDMEVAHSNSF